MKLFTKTLLATGLLAAASAQAGTINLKIYDNATAADAQNFKDSLFKTVAFEDFNDISLLKTDSDNDTAVDDALITSDGNGGNPQLQWEARSENGSIKSRVGTFTLDLAGQDVNGDDRPNELMIESDDTGEFNRENIDADGFWLDSNDARQITWDLWDYDSPESETFNALGFFLSDATDQGATLELVFKDGSSTTTSLGSLSGESDGNVKFVSITSDMDIQGGKVIFENSTASDGFGIDNIRMGKLPEPGTLLLMGLGLLGLGAARRRAAK